MELLNDSERASALTALPGWEYRDGSIVKQFVAASFHRAIAFVVQIGMLADAADHHPDIEIRYNRVSVTLSTHSAGGLTEKDTALAGRIDEAFVS